MAAELRGEFAAMLIWYVVMLAFAGLLVWPTIENRLMLRREQRDLQRARRR